MSDPNHPIWAALAIVLGFVALTMVLLLAWLCIHLWLSAFRSLLSGWTARRWRSGRPRP